MLHYNYTTLGMMMPTESKVVQVWLTKLQKLLDLGVADLNWTALAICNFVKNYSTAINDFKSQISQVC
jgi:hypothetical protein